MGHGVADVPATTARAREECAGDVGKGSLMRRYWWVPLLIAAIVDAGLVLHGFSLPGPTVSRAVRRSLLARGCQEGLLVRTASGPDELSLLHVRVQGAALRVREMRAEFAAGGVLTGASRASVAANADETTSRAAPAPAAGPHPLLSPYLQQLRARASWLVGDCLPLPNPQASHLHAAGTLRLAGAKDQVFHGLASFQSNGHPIFAAPASVWMGVGPRRTLAFAVVDGTLLPTDTRAVFASVFAYGVPGPPAAGGPSPAARLRLYQSTHEQIVALLKALGVHVPVGSASLPAGFPPAGGRQSPPPSATARASQGRAATTARSASRSASSAASPAAHPPHA